MKKIIVLFCLVISIQTAFSQNNTTDSLTTVLVITSRPIDRFNILNTISQNVGLYSGDIDSATCIELLQIAQELRNVSTLGLLIVFEFLNLLLHPFLERVTNHSPILMLLALVCIAGLLVPCITI